MNKNTRKFWQNFCQTHHLNSQTTVDAFSFGMTDQEADSLANLVNCGIKKATTSIYQKSDPLPKTGEYSIILDADENPVCVIREKLVKVVPYNEITADYAFLEGEGDRSYEYWRKTHDEFFKREIQGDFSEDTLMVCEIFEKIE